MASKRREYVSDLLGLIALALIWGCLAMVPV